MNAYMIKEKSPQAPRVMDYEIVLKTNTTEVSSILTRGSSIILLCYTKLILTNILMICDLYVIALA